MPNMLKRLKEKAKYKPTICLGDLEPNKRYDILSVTKSGPFVYVELDHADVYLPKYLAKVLVDEEINALPNYCMEVFKPNGVASTVDFHEKEANNHSTQEVALAKLKEAATQAAEVAAQTAEAAAKVEAAAASVAADAAAAAVKKE